MIKVTELIRRLLMPTALIAGGCVLGTFAAPDGDGATAEAVRRFSTLDADAEEPGAPAAALRRDRHEMLPALPALV